MKVTTNKILILFGIIALAIMACLPVSIFAMPLLNSGRPSQADSAATLQAIVQQTMIAMTQNAPSPTPTLYVQPSATPVPATSTPLPTATVVRYCDWVSFIKDVVPAPGPLTTSSCSRAAPRWAARQRSVCPAPSPLASMWMYPSH
jgi:hypothetical protein